MRLTPAFSLQRNAGARPISHVRLSSPAPPPACTLKSADLLSACSLRPPSSSRERSGPCHPVVGAAPAPGWTSSAALPPPALRTDTASSSASAGWVASGTKKRRARRASGTDSGHVGTEDASRGMSSDFSSDGGTAAPPEDAVPPEEAAGASISSSSPDASVNRLRLDASPAVLLAGSIARHSQLYLLSRELLRTLHAGHFPSRRAITGCRHCSDGAVLLLCSGTVATCHC